MTTNPADIFDYPDEPVRVRADGQPLGHFPSQLTPGELHRIEQIDEIHAMLNAVNAPLKDGNKILTVSERVQWLTSKYNMYEGRFICPACNQVWED